MQTGPSGEKEDLDGMADEYKRAYDEARITQVDTAPFYRQLGAALKMLESKHPMEGLTIAGTPPILLFTVPSQIPLSSMVPDKWGFWIWGWPGHFGASLTFKVMFYKYGDVGCRTWVPKSSPAFGQLREGRFCALFVRQGNILACFDVDFSCSMSALDKYSEHWSNVDRHVPEILEDESAHYWEVLKSTTYQPTSNTDRLAFSWFKSFAVSSNFAIGQIAEAQACGFDSTVLPTNAPAAIVALYRLLSTPSLRLTRVICFIRDRINEPGFLRDFFDFQLSFKEFVSSAIHRLAGNCLSLFLRSASQTNCGMRLCWIDGKNLKLCYLQIDTHEMSTEVASDYWTRLPDPDLFINWGHLIRGSTYQ